MSEITFQKWNPDKPDKAFLINKDGVLEGVSTNKNHIYVPDGVICIAENAFSGIAAKNIYLPDSVRTIMPCAFKKCEVEHIRLSSSLKEISKEAFMECLYLKTVDNADNIVLIEKRAFYGCINLEWISTLDRIEKINDEAFFDCQMLHLDIIMDIKYIGKRAFRNCRCIDIINGSKVKFIDDYAFENAGVLTVDFSDNKECYMGEGVFSNCKYLESANLSETMSDIPSKTFYMCMSLSMFSIPKGVDYIGAEAFAYCKSLRFIKDLDISFLGEGAFKNSGLKSVDMCGDRLYHISRNTFENCEDLIGIKLPDSVKRIEMFAFRNCKKLGAIYFPQGLKEIGAFAFYGCSENLTDLFLNSDVAKIEYQAFAECTALNDVFPAVNTIICDNAFFKSNGEKVKLIDAEWSNAKVYSECHTDEADFVDLMDTEVNGND